MADRHNRSAERVISAEPDCPDCPEAELGMGCAACGKPLPAAAPVADRDAGLSEVRETLAEHFVMWHDVEGRAGGEWRCACGKKFGFSDTAIDHVAEQVVPIALRGAADVVQAEHDAEVSRLTTAEHPEPYRVPMLSNWLGGIQTGATVLREAVAHV